MKSRVLDYTDDKLSYIQPALAIVLLGPDAVIDFMKCKTGEDATAFMVKWTGMRNPTVDQFVEIVLSKTAGEYGGHNDG